MPGIPVLFVLVLIASTAAWMVAVSLKPLKLKISGQQEGEESSGDSAAVVSDSGGGTATKPPKKRSGFIRPSITLIVTSIGLAAGTWWMTGWPAMGFMIFAAAQVSPYLSTKNSARQRSIEAAETVEKLANSITSLVSSGRKIEQATRAALLSPTVEFEEDAKAVSEKMELSFSAGLEELRNRMSHSLCDVLTSTLHFVATSEAGGRPAEALKSISDSAADTALMEKRIMVEQKKGYSSARTTLWISLLIMVFQAVSASDNYAIYNTMQGQMLLLAFGVMMGMGVWVTIVISKGRSLLRLTFPLRSRQQ